MNIVNHEWLISIINVDIFKHEVHCLIPVFKLSLQRMERILNVGVGVGVHKMEINDCFRNS